MQQVAAVIQPPIPAGARAASGCRLPRMPARGLLRELAFPAWRPEHAARFPPAVLEDPGIRIPGVIWE